MIQYYLDLQKQVKVISEHQLTYGQIQKIYSTAFFISLSIRAPGKTWHLYIGRGGGHEGVWLDETAPASVLRRKDTLLEYLRKHLSSCSFVSMDLDQSDRIIKLDYQKFGQLQSILFFWKARKLYFAHYYQESPDSQFKLLLSWVGKAVGVHEKPENLFDCFNEVGRRLDMKHDLASPVIVSIKELLADELKQASLKGLHSAPSFLQRKISNIEGDLNKARQWQQMQKILDQGDSLETYELKIGEHKIKFEGDLNPFERRNLLFEKIKKLKRGEGILTQRLAEAKDQLSNKIQGPKTASMIPIIKPVWGKEDLEGKVIKTTKAAEKDDYKVFKFENFSIGVGQSSSGNDQLRSRWASKEDLWLHLHGAKSAHAIIKMAQVGTPSSEVLDLAASILAYFSHFQGDWIPIIYTQVKNLKGVSGAPGMVIYKKEKHLLCRKIDSAEWLKE